jgi:hypothetical protein
MARKYIPLADTRALARDLDSIDYKPDENTKAYLLTHPSVKQLYSRIQHRRTPNEIVNNPKWLKRAFNDYIKAKEKQDNTGRSEYFKQYNENKRQLALQAGLPVSKRKKNNQVEESRQVPDNLSSMFVGALPVPILPPRQVPAELDVEPEREPEREPEPEPEPEPELATLLRGDEQQAIAEVIAQPEVQEALANEDITDEELIMALQEVLDEQPAPEEQQEDEGIFLPMFDNMYDEQEDEGDFLPMFGNMYDEPDIEGSGIVNVFSEFIKTIATDLDTSYEAVLSKFWTNKGLQRRWKQYKKTVAPTIFVPDQMRPQQRFEPLVFNIPSVKVEPYTTDYSAPKVIDLKAVYGKKDTKKQKAPIVERPSANIVLDMEPSVEEPEARELEAKLAAEEPEYEEPDIIPVQKQRAKPCPKGTRRYAPIGSECYTQAYIDEWQATYGRKKKAEANKLPFISADELAEIERAARQAMEQPIERRERELTPVKEMVLQELERELKDTRDTYSDNQWTWESQGRWDLLRHWGEKIDRLKQKINDIKFMNVEGGALGNYRVQSVIFRRDKWTPAKASKWLQKHNYANKGIDEKDEHLRFRQLNPDYIRKQGYKRFITKPLGDSGVSLIIAYK